MIYVKISGRLGNNLFQFAAAHHLSKDVCAVASDSYSVGVYNQYAGTLYSQIPLVDKVPKGIKQYQEESYAYHQIPYDETDDLEIIGFYQSYKYFTKEEAINLYQIPEFVLRDIEDIYGNFLNKNTVSINVRRGDYLKLPHRHPFCGLSYFKRAIAKFPLDSTFIVTSDDISWCKKHFLGDNFVFVEDSYPLLDLYIQTKCAHNIISNSSFSWWGAYLNPNPEQIVIAPKQWYGISLSHLDTSDLLPPFTLFEECTYDIGQKIKAYLLFLKAKLKTLIKK